MGGESHVSSPPDLPLRLLDRNGDTRGALRRPDGENYRHGCARWGPVWNRQIDLHQPDKSRGRSRVGEGCRRAPDRQCQRGLHRTGIRRGRHTRHPRGISLSFPGGVKNDDTPPRRRIRRRIQTAVLVHGNRLSGSRGIGSKEARHRRQHRNSYGYGSNAVILHLDLGGGLAGYLVRYDGRHLIPLAIDHRRRHSVKQHARSRNRSDDLSGSVQAIPREGRGTDVGWKDYDDFARRDALVRVTGSVGNCRGGQFRRGRDGQRRRAQGVHDAGVGGLWLEIGVAEGGGAVTGKGTGNPRHGIVRSPDRDRNAVRAVQARLYGGTENGRLIRRIGGRGRQQDIDAFKKYEYKIDYEIHGDLPLESYYTISNSYLKRLDEIAKSYKEILRKPFDFSIINESLQLDGDKRTFPKTEAERYD